MVKMKTFVRVTIIIWTLAFVGGLVTGKSAFSQDCRYEKIIKLTDDGKVLSSKTEYVCKGSKPIIVLPSTKQKIYLTTNNQRRAISTFDYIQYRTSNPYRWKKILIGLGIIK